jgi:hypothetical protein
MRFMLPALPHDKDVTKHIRITVKHNSNSCRTLADTFTASLGTTVQRKMWLLTRALPKHQLQTRTPIAHFTAAT